MLYNKVCDKESENTVLSSRKLSVDLVRKKGHIMRKHSLGLEVRLFEVVENHDASEFLGNNINKILNYIHTLGIKDKANDLLQDVALSLLKAEACGEGYDAGHFEGQYITVEQFVYSRIKAYAKNIRYQDNVAETGKTVNKVVSVEYVEKIGKDGNALKDLNGNTIYSKIKTTDKVNVQVNTFSASFEAGGDDIASRNDSFQKAYAEASVDDLTDDVDEKLSIKENIEICIDICAMYDIKIINVFKNIQLIASLLADHRASKFNAMFSKLREVIEYNDELADAFYSVLNFSSNHGDEFESLIAEY